MSKVKFKVGDLVYCPAESIKIRRLSLWGDDSKLSVINFPVTETGYLCSDDDEHSATPFIVHATQENYELLSQLYPDIEFEPPPKRKEPREIIQALLDDGNSGVLCWVSNYYHEPSYNNSKAQIVTVVNDDDFYCSGCSIMQYATPIMPIKTFNQKIIDFVDGEVVLENEK